jgi:phage shock protein A
MKETISTRVTRLVSGSLHALLDAMEQAAPEAAMAQAIREVEQVIDEVRAELGRVLASRHVAESNLARLAERHAALAAQIAVAVEKGEDDLSRVGIAKQLDIEAQRPVLEKAVAQAGDDERELQGYLLALQGRKRDMEDALNDFLAARARQARAGSGGAAPDGGAARAERAGSAFDRILARQTGVGSQAARDGAAEAAKLKELADLARNHSIEERLAALKAQRETQP